jgi:hypothetical protein
MGGLLDPVWAAATSGPGFLGFSKGDPASEDRDWGSLTLPSIFQKEEYTMRVLSILSLWEDLESVFAFSYNGLHGHTFSRRKEWFVATEWPGSVAWWVADDHTPTWSEACERYEILLQSGPSAQAFDFKHAYSPQGHPMPLDREAIKRFALHYRDLPEDIPPRE